MYITTKLPVACRTSELVGYRAKRDARARSTINKAQSEMRYISAECLALCPANLRVPQATK